MSCLPFNGRRSATSSASVYLIDSRRQGKPTNKRSPRAPPRPVNPRSVLPSTRRAVVDSDLIPGWLEAPALDDALVGVDSYLLVTPHGRTLLIRSRGRAGRSSIDKAILPHVKPPTSRVAVGWPTSMPPVETADIRLRCPWASTIAHQPSNGCSTIGDA